MYHVALKYASALFYTPGKDRDLGKVDVGSRLRGMQVDALAAPGLLPWLATEEHGARALDQPPSGERNGVHVLGNWCAVRSDQAAAGASTAWEFPTATDLAAHLTAVNGYWRVFVIHCVQVGDSRSEGSFACVAVQRVDKRGREGNRKGEGDCDNEDDMEDEKEGEKDENITRTQTVRWIQGSLQTSTVNRNFITFSGDQEPDHLARQELLRCVEDCGRGTGSGTVTYRLFPLSTTTKMEHGAMLFSGSGSRAVAQAYARGKWSDLCASTTVLIQSLDAKDHRRFGSYPDVEVLVNTYALVPTSTRKFYEYYISTDKCKMFWDYEFYISPGLDSEQKQEVQRRWQSFECHMHWAVMEVCEVEYAALPGVEIRSDSSRPKSMEGHAGKFWRPSNHGTHTGVVFPEGPAVQALFWQLVIWHAKQDGEDANFFYSKPERNGTFKDGEPVVDTAPYRTGELRMLGSCKGSGDPASLALLVAPAWSQPSSTPPDPSHPNKAIVAASLVTSYPRPPSTEKWLADAGMDKVGMRTEQLFPQNPVPVTKQRLHDVMDAYGVQRYRSARMSSTGAAAAVLGRHARSGPKNIKGAALYRIVQPLDEGGRAALVDRLPPNWFHKWGNDFRECGRNANGDMLFKASSNFCIFQCNEHGCDKNYNFGRWSGIRNDGSSTLYVKCHRADSCYKLVEEEAALAAAVLKAAPDTDVPFIIRMTQGKEGGGLCVQYAAAGNSGGTGGDVELDAVLPIEQQDREGGAGESNTKDDESEEGEGDQGEEDEDDKREEEEVDEGEEDEDDKSEEEEVDESKENPVLRWRITDYERSDEIGVVNDNTEGNIGLTIQLCWPGKQKKIADQKRLQTVIDTTRMLLSDVLETHDQVSRKRKHNISVLLEPESCSDCDETVRSRRGAIQHIIYRCHDTTNEYIIEFPSVAMKNSAYKFFISELLTRQLEGDPLINIHSTNMIIREPTAGVQSAARNLIHDDAKMESLQWDLLGCKRHSDDTCVRSAAAKVERSRALSRCVTSGVLRNHFKGCSEDDDQYINRSNGEHHSEWDMKYLLQEMELVRAKVKGMFGAHLSWTEDSVRDHLHTGVMPVEMEGQVSGVKVDLITGHMYRHIVKNAQSRKKQGNNRKPNRKKAEKELKEERQVDIYLSFQAAGRTLAQENTEVSQKEYFVSLVKNDVVFVNENMAYAYDNATATWQLKTRRHVAVMASKLLMRRVRVLKRVCDRYYPIRNRCIKELGFKAALKMIQTAFCTTGRSAHGANVVTQSINDLKDTHKIENRMNISKDCLPTMGKEIVCMSTSPPTVRARTREDYWSYWLPVRFERKERYDVAEKFMRSVFVEDPPVPDDDGEPMEGAGGDNQAKPHFETTQEPSDLAVMHCMQQVMGYLLTGELSLRKMFNLVGSGRNGKSMLMYIMQKILGPLYCVGTNALLTNKNGSKPESNKTGPDPSRAALKGKRLYVLPELAEDVVLDAPTVKSLVEGIEVLIYGRDCNEKGQDAQFFLRACFMILSNNQIRYTKSGLDDAMPERLFIIEMLIKFYLPEEVELIGRRNHRPCDQDFVDSLADEHLSEMFSYFVQGASKLYAANLQLVVPPKIQQATSRNKRLNDSLEAFITSKIHYTGEKTDLIECSLLHNAYDEWCVTSNKVAQGGKAAAFKRKYGKPFRQTVGGKKMGTSSYKRVQWKKELF
jgi:hypothetical protein